MRSRLVLARRTDDQHGGGSGRRQGPPVDQSRLAPRPLGALLVAVPARNEAASIERCLTSIAEASAHVALPVVVAVAADSCNDATADVAGSVAPSGHCAVVVTSGSWRAVGAARRAAVDAGIAQLPTLAEHVWIASTDADCAVPADWLVKHCAAAQAGLDAVSGRVMLDPDSTSPSMLAWFATDYGRSRAHVHGANLGVALHAYTAVGGWCRHTVVGEDHRLWRDLRGAGFRAAYRPELVVATSSRTSSRVVGGFASRLRTLSSVATAERSA